MKILIAYDGSSCADLALEDMRRASFPLAQLEERISRNSRQISDLARSNQDLLANLSLPTKLSNDFNNGVCLISGSYVFIDPNTGLPLRGMKNLKDESGEVEQPQLTTGADSEIAEVFIYGDRVSRRRRVSFDEPSRRRRAVEIRCFVVSLRQGPQCPAAFG